jgi:hypothetical protein
MGLLDEAIREHLELKRRRGADPGAIAREEREVLEPVSLDEQAGPEDDGGHAEQEAARVAAEIAPAGAVPVDDHLNGHEAPADLSPVGQETAELDMQAVMDEDPDPTDSAPPVGTIADEPALSTNAVEAPAEDPLEWEKPNERAHESAPQDVPGQERLSFE